ncbi:unnamed protein product [Rotaria sp. Silwood2]|nr:unnamed protein product [Rotaria sp. Silwood2]
MKTTGWIGLGISPAGGMPGADIALGWVDQTGTAYIQDRYACSYSRPIMDKNEVNWIVLQGREVNGWTAIQFKRMFDTCDSMDVPITFGTNKLIFAYGLVDPDLSQPNNDITYHGNRRGSRILPLPNLDIVHHLLLYECDSTTDFHDTILPEGLCDKIDTQVGMCIANIALGWAVGGNFIVEYPKEAGYPLGANFSVAYYMIQVHYNNPQGISNRVDSSGVRFFLGNTLRHHSAESRTVQRRLILSYGSDSSLYRNL